MPAANSDRCDDGESQELVSSRLNARVVSGCNDLQPLKDVGTFERSSEDVNVSNSSNFILILKKVGCVSISCQYYSLTFCLNLFKV